MMLYRHNYVLYTVANMAVKVANEETTTTEEYDDVLIDFKQDGQPTSFLTKNVWFIPHLDTNLLSITELEKDKVTVFFNVPHLPSLLFQENKYLGLIKAINRKY